MDSNPALAEQQAREILKPFPNEINALTLLGAALRVQRKFEPALETLEKAIKRDPGLGLARQEIGMTLLAIQHFPELKSTLLPIVLASTVIFELIGPVITRRVLIRVGEVNHD